MKKQFRSLFEEHSAVKLLIDPSTGSIVDANKAAAAYYGWSVEELRNMLIHDINTFSPEEVKCEIENARSTGKNKFMFRHRRANASIRDVEVLTSKIEIAGKDLLYSIVHDVTERNRYEQLNAFRLRVLQLAETSSKDELLTATLDEAEKLTGSSIGFVFFCSRRSKQPAAANRINQYLAEYVQGRRKGPALSAEPCRSLGRCGQGEKSSYP